MPLSTSANRNGKGNREVGGIDPETMVITSLEDVTVDWLTSVLLNSDALVSGAVVAYEAEAGAGNWSSNARLRLTYGEGAEGERPEHLFLKMTNTDLDDGETFGPSEVDYYTRDYLDVPDAPLIRCYDAAFSAEKQRYHVLLDDVSDTHIDSTDKSPTLEYGLAMADGLAVMHAHWWGAQRLTAAGAPIHEAAFIQEFVDIAAPGAEHIINELSDELEPHWPETLQALFTSHPRALIERTANDNGFTLIHGDLGQYNVMVPRKGDRPVYFIDRQPFNWSLTTWLGAYDLAYAIVIDWDSEVRRRLELPVLRRYHEELGRHGVTDYAWDRLYDDYRLSIATCVCVAVEYCRGGIDRSKQQYWLPMLRRTLIACDDLACDELW